MNDLEMQLESHASDNFMVFNSRASMYEYLSLPTKLLYIFSAIITIETDNFHVKLQLSMPMGCPLFDTHLKV